MIPGSLAMMSGGAEIDPYFSSVVMLLHMDGSDGSTTFTDVKSHTFTPVGNVQIDTAQSKFGGACLLADGVNDYITTPSTTEWDWSAQDYTVEGFIRVTAHGDVGGHPQLLGKKAGVTDWWSFGPNVSGVLVLYYWNGAGIYVTGVTALSTGVWYHVAFTLSGTTIRLFLNGVQDQSASVSGTPQTDGSTTLSIAESNFNGWIDEVRITKGVARYTTNFTPPSSPFPDN